MSRVVLDASALLALLGSEPGAEKLSPELLSEAICGTVNLAEVQSKLMRWGLADDDAWEAASGAVREIMVFTAEQARIAGSLITETSALGLSLGDRACLALAICLKAPVYTADRLWKNLKLGIRIHVLR